MERKIDLVLTGCGAAAVYWIGHMLALRAAHVDVGRVYAASSGALVGAALLCDVDPVACLRVLRAAHGRRWLACAMHEAMQTVLPSDAHTLCSGRLFVRTMRAGVPLRSVCTSVYATRADLLDVLFATTVIPFVTAPMFGHPLVDGSRHLDGVVAPSAEPRPGFELVVLPVAMSLASVALPSSEEVDIAVVRGAHAMCAILGVDPVLRIDLSPVARPKKTEKG